MAIKFQVNIPQTLYFPYGDFMEVEGQYGQQMLYTVEVDGTRDRLYATPKLHGDLQQSGVGPGDLVTITKAEGKGNRVQWRVEREGATTHPQTQSQLPSQQQQPQQTPLAQHSNGHSRGHHNGASHSPVTDHDPPPPMEPPPQFERTPASDAPPPQQAPRPAEPLSTEALTRLYVVCRAEALNIWQFDTHILANNGAALTAVQQTTDTLFNAALSKGTPL